MSEKSELAISVQKQLETLFSDVTLSLDRDYRKLLRKMKYDISKAFLHVDKLSFLLYLYDYTNYSFLQVIDAIQEDGSINDWCIYIETVYLYRELIQRELEFYPFLYELETKYANFKEFSFTSHEDWKKRIHLYLEYVRTL